MDLFQNPFHILNSTPQDNRQWIMELADSGSLRRNPNECRDAASTLTHPRRRLAAEMAWMLGVLPKHVDSVLSYLKFSVRNLIGIDKLTQFRNRLGVSKMIPIASTNLLAAGLSRLPDYPSDVVASWIVEIAKTSEKITLEQVREVINVERKVSGFPRVDLSDIEAEIQNLRDYYRQVMTFAMNQLSVNERARAMTEIVESTTADEKQFPRLIDRLVDWYKLDVQESLEENEKKIEDLDRKLRLAVDEERPDSALAPVVDQLVQTVNNWNAIAQPIQVSKNRRGLSNTESRRVAWRVRDLAEHLFYEYDKLDFCQKCIKILRQAFAVVPEISEVLAKDMRKLTNIARTRDQKAPPSAEEFARMKEELDGLKAKNAEYEKRSNRMLLTIADYENSKKRAEREKAEFFKYAVEGVIKDLILVVDSIEKGIESAKESGDFDSLNEGIQLIHKQLGELLKKRDVTVIKAQGEPFDPNLHEAVMYIDSEDVEENAVIEEFQRGYLLHERVIRPSMVSVSRGKPQTENTLPDDEGEKEEKSNE